MCQSDAFISVGWIPRCGIAGPDSTFVKWIFINLMDCAEESQNLDRNSQLRANFLDVKVDGN